MIRKLSTLAILIAAGAFLTAPALAGPPTMGNRNEARDAAHMPQEVLVQFRPGVGESQKLSVRGRVGAMLEEVVVQGAARSDRGGDLELLKLPPGISIAAAAREMGNDPAVEFVEPNWVYFHTATSDDPYYTSGSLWGMYGDATSPTNQYGSQAGEAWAANHTGSNSVHIGIIDEGVMHSHEDLAANIWINPFDPVDGIDNDGNGYVDDKWGWDFDGNDNSTFDGSQDDHGTHVAGTTGAKGGNGKGVAGVTWNVKLITAKFLGRNGGTTANAIKSVDYMTGLKARHGLDIVATNNSWGGGGFSQGLYDAIERANAANILFIAAAGNDSKDIDASPSYPASYTNANIIVVASITSSGALSSFSNYGATSVDIGAPGSGIYSTLPSKQKTSTYGSYSGTSMATPHVAGAVALYAATYSARGLALKDAVLAAGTPTSSLSGKCTTGDRLNAGGF